MPSIAVADWLPDKMGYPTINNYGYHAGMDPRGYNVADGSTEFRLNQIDSAVPFHLNFMMSAEQFAYFESFWIYTLLNGTEWFTMPLRTGLGLIVLDVHISDDGYDAEYLIGSDAWQVSFSVSGGYGRMVRESGENWILNSSDGYWLLNDGTGTWETN